MAFTTGGLDVFESGPTNFTISFSGANANGTYLKFLVNYPNDDQIYTVSAPTDDIDSIRTQSISKTFYPEHDEYLTTYSIEVSGLKNDLSSDIYRINLNLGRDVLTKYGDIRVVGSHLYTSDQGSNYCLLTLENQEQRFVSNVIIPFTKSSEVYVPEIPPPFIPNDNKVLRSEILTSIGGQIPICVEVSFNEVVTEEQYEIVAFGSENAYHGQHAIFEHYINGYPSRSWAGYDGLTTGEIARGDTIDDSLIWAPEDGIDYSKFKEEVDGGVFENDGIINVTILDIYPSGIAS